MLGGEATPIASHPLAPTMKTPPGEQPSALAATPPMVPQQRRTATFPNAYRAR